MHVVALDTRLICTRDHDTAGLNSLHMQARTPEKVRKESNAPLLMKSGTDQSNEMLLAGVHALSSIW